MALFGVSRTQTVDDPILGELVHARGFWRGRITLAGREMPLLIAGRGQSPDASAIAIAHGLPDRYSYLQTAIGAALFEHYDPYRGAFDDGALQEPFPRINDAAGVWPHVTPLQVTITPAAAGRFIAEIAYTTEWDVEHTLGAMIADWQLTELNGSIRMQR